MSKSLVRPIVHDFSSPVCEGRSRSCATTADKAVQAGDCVRSYQPKRRRIKHGKEFQFHIHGRVVRDLPPTNLKSIVIGRTNGGWGAQGKPAASLRRREADAGDGDPKRQWAWATNNASPKPSLCSGILERLLPAHALNNCSNRGFNVTINGNSSPLTSAPINISSSGNNVVVAGQAGNSHSRVPHGDGGDVVGDRDDPVRWLDCIDRPNGVGGQPRIVLSVRHPAGFYYQSRKCF